MREILFRGKSIKTKEWVYGYYAYIEVRHYIISATLEWNEDLQMEQPKYTEIELKTFGQYTGLEDKSGQKIFEGDVLSVDCYSYYEFTDYYFGEVIMGGLIGLGVYNSKNDKIYDLYECQGEYTTIYEVIGNIHDNPELLEEQQ